MGRIEFERLFGKNKIFIEISTKSVEGKKRIMKKNGEERDKMPQIILKI